MTKKKKLKFEVKKAMQAYYDAGYTYNQTFIDKMISQHNSKTGG